MFDHEKLRVYRETLRFASEIEGILSQTTSRVLRDQLDRARTSILLNIAEGNGRFTAADRCRFFDTARGSALECAACIDLLLVKKVITAEESKKYKDDLETIVSMLVGLIRSNSVDRLHESSISYRATAKRDYDED